MTSTRNSSSPFAFKPPKKSNPKEDHPLNQNNPPAKHSRQNSTKHTSIIPSPRIPFSSIANLQQNRKECNNYQNVHLIGAVEKELVVGKGGFGKVWRVNNKNNGKTYALKQMSKALVIAKKSVPSVMNEKTLLSQLQNFFLVNLLQAAQDRKNLYLLLDYLPGGDLRMHLSHKKFTEQQSKFLITCILLGLKYLHSKNIIHRDIKPQNIVLDHNGYAHITDLGVARPYRLNNNCDTSGTPGYMAPQVLCRQDHSYGVDYFAVGVIAHQFMMRRRPFRGRSRKEIREEVIARQPVVRKHQIPDDWSLEAADFINRLIQRKPNQRLGSSSIDDIFRHPWLRNFPVDKIATRSVRAPWSPDCQANYDDDFSSSEQTELQDLIAQNQLMLRKPQVQELFSGYDYLRPSFRLI